MIRPRSHASHSTRNRLLWQEGIAVALLFAAIVLLAFWPQLVESRRLYWGDIDLYFTPSLTFLRGNMRDGIIPLWNPRLFCGTPYVGNPQTWPFYPVSMLLNWLSVGDFINWSLAIHVYIAGIGTYVLARKTCGLSVGASLLSSIIFMLGGQMVSKEQFPAMVQAISWIPILIWVTSRLAHNPDSRKAVVLGVLGGLELLSGHGQIAVLGTYLCTAVFIVVLVHKRGHGIRQVGYSIALVLLSGIIALGISAVQTLPMIEFMSHAARQTLSLRLANRFYLPINQLWNFVLPTLHGHPIHGTWKGRMNFWETNCYIGFVPLSLAIFGLTRSIPDRRPLGSRFWSVTAILTIWLALGRSGGLYTGAFFSLPLLRSFHDPARFLVLGCLSLSILAGLGLDSLELWLRPRKRYRYTTIALPVFVLVVLAATTVDLARFDRTIYPLIPVGYLHRQLPVESLALHDKSLTTHQTRFLAPDTATTWQVFTSYHDYRENWPNYFGTWYDTATPNLYMSNGLSDAFGYDPFMPKAAQDVAGITTLSLLDTATPPMASHAAQLSAALGVRWVVLYRRDDPANTLPDFTEISTPAPTVDISGRPIPKTYVFFDNLTVGRARYTNSFLTRPNAKAAQAYLSDTIVGKTETNLAQTVILGDPTRLHPGRVPYVVPITVRDRGPDALSMRFKAKGPGMLVLSDTDLPGWDAWKDGIPSPILMGDSMIRVVPISSKGWHTVVMRYNPESFHLGLFFSLCMACLLSAWVTGIIFSRPKAKS